MILDTSVVIDRVKRGKEITENITSITLIEYPPIASYKKFFGNVYFVSEEDQILAVSLQIRLRKIGMPMSASDLLIAAVCIRTGELFMTYDEDFLSIRKVWPSFQVILMRP